ncbi:MAG TPA: FAD-dependent oxidoreductase [Anaerolineaceae bacterium]
MIGSLSHRYVIVGCGVAGLAAAQTIRRADPSGSIAIVSEDPFGYYSRPGLAFYLTGEIPEESLYPISKADLKSLRLNWIVDRVTRLEPAQHRILLEKKGTMGYDRLLVATGSVAAMPPVPGIDLEGVVKLDSLEDARRILQLSRRAKTAVVVGGGITALELVEALTARKVKVQFLLRGDHYWSSVLDESESLIVEDRLRDEGVILFPRTELAAIEGDHGRVHSLTTQDGRTLQADMVGVAIGIRARKELAEAAGLITERGILVDAGLRTSQADIFAAGDVAQVYDPLTGAYVLDSLWGPAREMGRTAGMNMSGAELVYTKSPSFNVTRLSGLTTTIIGMVGREVEADLVGLTHGDAEIWRQVPDAIVAQNNFDVNHLRLQVGRETLLGAVLIGDQTLSEPLQNLILSRANILPVREELLACQQDLPQLLANFWMEWRRTHAA